MYFSRNAPETATLRPIEDHPPLEDLVPVGKVKQDSGVKIGHPSAPACFCMGDSIQVSEYRPCESQLPRKRAWRKIERFSPVMN